MSQTSILANYPMFAMCNETEGNRVLCLYRVSSNGQLHHTENNEADIPMQRLACRKFAEQMGWIIVCELQEEGVSGHKVRAEQRDQIQRVKELAKQKKFDILLVFMFDRIGRIADETPFVVEWLINAGIRVWSAKEGEQRIESHTDRLTNYIRYWQADGESQKTSIRTSTRLAQLTTEGYYTGRGCPYGYKLVKRGRLNKKGVELNDLAINEDEAPVVRLIFDKYVLEGFGPQRIANYLRELGIKNRSGKNFHPATIRGMLRNPLYMGILRSGEARSQIIPELQIITEQMFERTAEISRQRSGAFEENRSVPLNTRGNALLAGNVFCGHCGARLSITTNGRGGTLADGTKSLRTRYCCQTKTRTHENCDGQTGYTTHILDGMIDDIVRDIFRKVGGFKESEAVQRAYKKLHEEKNARVRQLQREAAQTEKAIQNLRKEVLKALEGQSVFDLETLSVMLKEQEAKAAEQTSLLKAAKQEANENTALIQQMQSRYNQFVEWAYVYSTANMATRKMIVSQLIERVEVCRDYKLRIQFTLTVEQFLQGLEVAA